jgi:predicted thioesterase
MDLSALADAEPTGAREFTVERRHTTTVFGEQTDPPGLPAAADATGDERVHVLGTPQLLAACEFAGRESLRGRLPDGTGTVGERAAVTHRRAAPEGTRVRVATLVTGVDGPKVHLDATATRLGGSGSGGGDGRGDGSGTGDGDAPPTVGEVELTFRVVSRERFRAALE